MVPASTIVTCPAAASITQLRARMPAIIPRDHWAIWLDQEPGAPDYVLATFDGDLKFWEISATVDNVGNDDLDSVLTVDTL